MLWEVDRTAPQPLHEQIAASVRRAVSDGTLAGGERLPPARELAAVLQVNANTVLHAYRTLRTEGLLEFRRGRDVRVRSDIAGLTSVIAAARHLLEVGGKYGYTQHELSQMLATLVRQPS
jgi:GntR family transcriptional regulator